VVVVVVVVVDVDVDVDVDVVVVVVVVVVVMKVLGFVSDQFRQSFCDLDPRSTHPNRSLMIPQPIHPLNPQSSSSSSSLKTRHSLWECAKRFIQT